MTSALFKTITFLAKSDNPAAIDLLRVLLDNKSDPEITEHVFLALYRKHNHDIYMELFLRFLKEEKEWKDSKFITPDRLTKLAGEAFTSGDDRMMQLATQIILRHKLYESIPLLLSFVESHREDWAVLSSKTALALAESFYETLLHCGSELERRNMDRQREWFTQQLEQSVRSYTMHGMIDVLKAYLIVAKKEYGSFLSILGDHLSKVSKAIVKLLEEGEHGSFIRLLLSFIDDPESPALVDNILSGKDDPRFIKNFLVTIGAPPTQQAKTALKRFKSIKWVQLDDPDKLLATIEGAEPCFVHLVSNISIPKETLAELYRFVFKRCSAEARRAAVECLRTLPTEEFSQILVDAVQDPDPIVCSEALRIVKSRNVKDVDQIIMRCVDRPEKEVLDAIYDLLPDFHIEAYLQKIDQLPEPIAKTFGKIVRKIDPSTEKYLGEEISSFAPFRRQAAATAIHRIGIESEFQASLCRLALEDEETNVRVAACTALSELMTKEAIQTLQEAMHDKTYAIRTAAANAVQHWMSLYNRKKT